MIKNILILNMTRMGDLIQSTPVIVGLRKQYPSSRITLLVTNVFADFSKKIPHIDERVIFDISQFEKKEQLDGIFWIKIYKYIESLLNKLREQKFDLLINLSHSKLSAFMISYLEVKDIRGFACNGAGDRMTSDPWMQYFGIEPFNRIFNPFNLVEIFTRSTGATLEGNPISIQQDSSVSESTLDIYNQHNIQEGDFVVGIQAGSSLKGRRWSSKSFAELADGLVDSHNAKIILFGVLSENILAQEIKSYIHNKDEVIDLTGKTSIGQLLNLVKRCSYLVSNDTGTMHIAAAVGTPIIGLFFAHAHPFETGPYSTGNLIFQARIPCAPCSYGVECNNVVCINKVRPDHLLSMIKIHQDEGVWRIPISMSGLEEVYIYKTDIGDDFRLQLYPLVKHPLSLNDIFREIYSSHWLDTLGAIMVDGSISFDIEKNFWKYYDCSNANFVIQQILERKSRLRNLEKLTLRGILIADEIAQICSSKILTNMATVKVLADKIELLDEEISQIGFTHPELKPITDMFNKRKENFQGNDPVQLAKDTRKCYQKLIKDSEGMRRRLRLAQETLKSLNNVNCQAAVNSFSVEVPGK